MLMSRYDDVIKQKFVWPFLYRDPPLFGEGKLRYVSSLKLNSGASLQGTSWDELGTMEPLYKGQVGDMEPLYKGQVGDMEPLCNGVSLQGTSWGHGASLQGTSWGQWNLSTRDKLGT